MTKIFTENVFNGDHFPIDLSLNSYTAKNVYLRALGIIWFS